MVRITILASLLFSAGPRCSLCTTLSAQRDGDLMRKEVRHVQFSSSGEVLAAVERADVSSHSKQEEFCEYGYVLGQAGTNLCQETGHSLIIDINMCIKAASDAGVTAPSKTFVIPQDWETKKPEGCFHGVCAEDPVKGCFFYNPVGYNNSDSKDLEPDPRPVCSRSKYMFAERNSVGNDADCPNGYKPITTLKACEDAGICKDRPPATQVRLWTDNHNEATTLNFPKHCFFGDDNRTRINEENQYWASGTFDPTGTPICIEETSINIQSIDDR
mmetsp:Transcript_83389/g.131278  ORF Transcript_83389/g.131278 Transcript_83389/m.131278 type:complete len:273 (+) Transcript_83389:66-884(+)